MKSFLLHQLSRNSFRKNVTILFAATTLLLASNEAFGWVAAGGGGRGFAVAGRGYGCAGVGRYGAVGFRGGLPAGYYGTIPGAYRAVVYGGYNCYYSGGVYYRPALANRRRQGSFEDCVRRESAFVLLLPTVARGPALRPAHCDQPVV